MVRLLLIGFLLLIIGGFSFWAYQYLYVDPNINYPEALESKLPSATILQRLRYSEAGKVLEYRKVQSYTPAQIDQLANAFYGSHPKIPATNGVDRYQVYYTSYDQNNQPITIMSQLFIPQTLLPQEYLVYVFGQGTTGIGDQCAPSLERPEISNWGNYIAHMLSYSGNGMIAMFPDYEGFNDASRIHHYFIAELEGRVLLDGARATYNFFEKEKMNATPMEAVFFTGYSEGGHAAFAAGDIHQEYAPDVPMKGIIGYGSTTNIINLLKENPSLTPYLLYAYSDYYGKERLDPANYMMAKWLPTLEHDVTTKCVSEITAYYQANPREIFSTKFYNALYNNQLDENFPRIREAFEENSSGLTDNGVPSLVVQGGIDPIVTNKSQDEFVEASCAVGNEITYLNIPGVHHYQIRQAGTTQSIAWMKKVIAGQSVPNDCANL